ncbi:MAG: hypothetical protein IJI60_01710 [Bacilli bacterium]|nr:hypothetical protein [Bacilli bacterium]
MYRCKYSEVTQQGEEVEKWSKKLAEYIIDYNAKLKRTCSEWGEDDIRQSFDNSMEGIYKEANKYAQFGKEMGQFVQKASTKIKALDELLSGLKI